MADFSCAPGLASPTQKQERAPVWSCRSPSSQRDEPDLRARGGAVVERRLPHELGDQKVFLLRLTSPGGRHKPTRHPASTGPCVSRVIAVLNSDLPSLASAAAKEVANIEPMLFGKTKDFMPHRRPLGILLLGLDPLDTRLHCREFCCRHILEVFCACHVCCLREELNPLGILNASV